MISIIKNILKFLSHHNWRIFLKKVYCILIKPLYENNARYILKLDLSAAAEPDPTLTIEELNISDMSRIQDVMYATVSSLKQRFERHDRCFAVLEKGRIISYFWARFNDRELPELHLKFNLHSNQTWMYNAVTIKTARGRGLYPNIIRYMAKALIKSGIDEAFIDVDPDNVASRRGLEKAGCEYIILIRMKKIFSNIKYKLNVSNTSDWRELSGEIENFNQKQFQCIRKPNICL